MEKTKRKNGELHLRRYWLFFVPLMLILALMIPHPLRFGVGELSDDGLLYGIIALLCLMTAIRVFRRAGKSARLLAAMILVCAALAAWQPFDIFVLRDSTGSTGYGGTSPTGAIPVDLPEGFMIAWYSTRNDNIPCHAIYERYFGNRYIMMTLEINRNAVWYACSG